MNREEAFSFVKEHLRDISDNTRRFRNDIWFYPAKDLAKAWNEYRFKARDGDLEAAAIIIEAVTIYRMVPKFGTGEITCRGVALAERMRAYDKTLAEALNV